MISGKLALGGMSVEFGNAKERFEHLSARSKTLTARQAKLLAEEASIIETLAELYLPELSPEAVSAGLTQLSSKMDDALAAQAEHRRVLAERLATVPEEVSRKEFLVAEAEGAEERAARGLDGVRREVERELGERPEHAEAILEHRAVMERRSILKDRRSRLQTTANVEKFNYEQDRAFAYLQRRAFGEPEYRGGALARRLDGWLARRIDYEVLRRNYRILRTGPHAIQAELRTLTERATALEAIIDGHESQVAARTGFIAALESETKAQESLVEAREALAESRALYDRLAGEIRAADANLGRPYEDALATHREFLESRTIRELLEIARSTPDPRDDGLASDLEKIRSELTAIGRELRPVRDQLEETNTKVTNFSDLVRNAATHFTSRRSYFSEELDVPMLLSKMMDGRTDPAAALAALATTHRKTPLLVAERASDYDSWFADLSAPYDVELGAVEVREERGTEAESEVVVYDQHGRVLHRRVTKRS